MLKKKKKVQHYTVVVVVAAKKKKKKSVTVYLSDTSTWEESALFCFPAAPQTSTSLGACGSVLLILRAGALIRLGAITALIPSVSSPPPFHLHTPLHTQAGHSRTEVGWLADPPHSSKGMRNLSFASARSLTGFQRHNFSAYFGGLKESHDLDKST